MPIPVLIQTLAGGKDHVAVRALELRRHVSAVVREHVTLERVLVHERFGAMPAHVTHSLMTRRVMVSVRRHAIETLAALVAFDFEIVYVTVLMSFQPSLLAELLAACCASKYQLKVFFC